jgi:hypothetical protein
MEPVAPILHTFNQAVNNKLSHYKGIYECECPDFNRSLPFRAQFTEHLIKEINLLVPTTAHLVYVSMGPGGFFFDFVIINKLVQEGYKNITLIFIEELYQEHISILQACLDLKEWFTEIRQAHPNQPLITPYFFYSNEEYNLACTKNPELKGHVLCTVDPDDPATLTNFDCVKFNKNFTQLCQQTMQQQSIVCSLFAHNNQRNMILGTIDQTDNFLLAYDHYYGRDDLYKNKNRRVFFESHEVLPFEPLQYGVQVNGDIFTCLRLHALLHPPKIIP